MSVTTVVSGVATLAFVSPFLFFSLFADAVLFVYMYLSKQLSTYKYSCTPVPVPNYYYILYQYYGYSTY